MRALVTGAAGFVGRRLVARLAAEPGMAVRAAVHRDAGVVPSGVERIVADLESAADWRPALADVDVVMHLAARVHVMHDTAADPLQAFRRVNVEGTMALARQAAAAGVRRFVFVSSVKVNGETGRYTETDPPAPGDPYALSKLEAEQALRALAADSGMQVVTIRPPLVYGPGVRANFAALIAAIARGVPLPFGSIDNRRSLVAVDNLVDFIVTCATHPQAANETFLVSDGEDLSTADLVRRLARAMGRSPRLLPVPPAVLRLAAATIGRASAAQRLLGSLQVDITKARQRLDWRPPVSVDEALRRTVEAHQ